MTAASCSCPQDGGMSRRGLLGRALALGTVGALAGPALATRTAFAVEPAAYTGDVLLVLSLRGGFDGLSAVVPSGDPDYYRKRPSIGVPAGQLAPLDAMFGLHPALSPLLPWWKGGTLGFVQAVGQADPSRSHFHAMAELERAAPGTSARTGWIDRALGLRAPGSSFQAAQVGDTGASPGLAGPAPELTLSSVDGFELAGAWDATERARWDRALRGLYAGAPPVLAAPALTTLGALATTAALKQAGYAPANGAAYPVGSHLGGALRDVARLVKARVGLQVACVDYGDWDMHEGLGAGGDRAGWMHAKLAELAAALAAFATDLGPAGMAGVTVVTLSEFGRRVGENDSGGVDHGHGNAVLLMGGGVVGGRVHGRWPGLAGDRLVDGDLAGTTDYRLLLGEVLQKRCRAGSLASVFPNLTGTPLGVVRPRP